MLVTPNAFLVERHGNLTAAPLRGEARARTADDDLSHRASRDREEMPAVLYPHALLARELHIGLVNQAGGIESRAAVGAS